MARPKFEGNNFYYLYSGYDSYGNYNQSVHFFNAFERRWEGSTLPNYYALKKAKMKLANLPYYVDTYRVQNEGTVSYRVVDWPQYQTVLTKPVHYASGAPLNYGFPSLVPESRNKATRKLYAKVEGVRFNAAQFLGERKQVAELMASTATRIVSAARALKHGDLRTFQQSLSLSGTNLGDRELVARAWKRAMKTSPEKRLSSHWLEFVYGWRPLLDDVTNSAELLAESISRARQPEGIVKAGGLVKQGFRRLVTGPGNRVTVDISDVHTCHTRITVHYRLEDEARSLLQKTGISNPLLLAWELLPFSFVVDWFLPVGNYLDSLTAMDGFVLTDGVVSTLQTAASTRRVGYVNTEPTYRILDFIGGTVYATQGRYQREVNVVSFPYALRVRNPIGGNPLERFLTATALLGQLFGRDGSRQPTYRNPAMR